MQAEILLVEDLENLLQWFWLEIRFNAPSVVNDFMKTTHHHLQEVKDTMSYFYITCEEAKFKHFPKESVPTSQLFIRKRNCHFIGNCPFS